MQEAFRSGESINHQQQEEELETAAVQICPKCGEPMVSRESFHECGKLGKLLRASRNRQGNTPYPDLEKIYNESRKIWNASKESGRSQEGKDGELMLELDHHVLYCG